jgi:hypothetical protein
LVLGGYVEAGVIGSAASLGWLLLPLLFTALGSVIATRQPRNRISWLLLIVGFSILVDAISNTVVTNQHGTPSVWDNAALAVAGGAWLGISFPIFLLLYLFPTGRFLTPRWRWAGRIWLLIVASFLVISVFVEEWGTPDAWVVTNPIGFIPVEVFDGPFGVVWILGLLALVLGGVGSLVARFRRAGALERTQVKWIVYAAVVFAIGYTLAGVSQVWATSESLLFMFLVIGVGVLPVSITLAITRYKLFEIDRIISRTLSYAVVVTVLGVLFFGLVTLITSLLPAQSSLAVAGATLAVAATFNPLRMRIQHLVDRRFNRAGYQTMVISEQFAGELIEPRTSEEIIALWSQTIEAAMQPQTAGVWLRDARPQPASFTPGSRDT